MVIEDLLKVSETALYVKEGVFKMYGLLTVYAGQYFLPNRKLSGLGLQ